MCAGHCWPNNELKKSTAYSSCSQLHRVHRNVGKGEWKTEWALGKIMETIDSSGWMTTRCHSYSPAEEMSRLEKDNVCSGMCDDTCTAACVRQD